MSTGAVIVEYDGQQGSQRVLDYAACEAMRAGAELVLVRAYRNYATDPFATFAEDVLEQAAKRIEQHYGGRLKVSTLSLEGSRAKVFARAAEGARLVVIGRETAGGLPGLRAAQSSLRVATAASCPVVVVPTRWRPSPTAHSVVVGVDGTPLSLEAVEYAFRVAAERGMELSVVHSYWMRYPVTDRANNADIWLERASSTVAESLAGCVEAYPQVRVSRVLTTRPVIATLARESAYAELVILGAHAGGGSVADPTTRRAIAEMSCPIAIVAHHQHDNAGARS